MCTIGDLVICTNYTAPGDGLEYSTTCQCLCDISLITVSCEPFLLARGTYLSDIVL